jgi:hypothetical protein
MVTVIDMISRNRDGIEIPKIERLVGNNTDPATVLQDWTSFDFNAILNLE